MALEIYDFTQMVHIGTHQLKKLFLAAFILIWNSFENTNPLYTHSNNEHKIKDIDWIFFNMERNI